MKTLINLIFTTLLIHIISVAPLNAEIALLVDFGSSEQENIYNISDFPGWTNVDYGGAVFSSSGPGGMATSGGGIFHNYQRISGQEVTLFPGDEIIVTWYNNTGEMISYWVPLISFEDLDNPDSQEGEPQWYPLFDFDSWKTDDLAIGPVVNYMQAGDTVKTVYEISSLTEAPGDAPATEGKHTIISISANLEKSGMICDKIEIRRASEFTPNAPANLTASLHPGKSDTAINLSWESSTQGDVLHYRIYRDGFWIAKTKETSFTMYNLESSKTYTFEVRGVFNQYAVSEPTVPVTVTMNTFQGENDLINPRNELTYIGAFRYPEYSEGSGHTWTHRWGGMTYYPSGDPENLDNDSDYTGSIYSYGHSYGHRIAEISIPEPVSSKNYDELPRAQMLVESFKDVKPVNDERPSDYGHPGVTYLSLKNKFYTTFGHYYNQSGGKWLSHGSFNPDYTDIQGLWYVGDKNNDIPAYYAYNKYMTDIPVVWADENIEGYYIASGANHTGADPMGPGLVAIRPWNADGSVPQPGAEIDFTTLIQYDLRGGEKSVDGWNQKDFWMGMAWLENTEKSAVVISGNKSFGEYFYGYQDGSLVGEVGECVPQRQNTDGGDKGGQARGFRGMLLFYNPDDLARVAKSQKGIYQEEDAMYMEPNEPQPYACLDIDHLLLRENLDDPSSRDRITGMTFDKERGLLYLNENDASDGKYDVIHVFRIPTGTDNTQINDSVDTGNSVSGSGGGGGCFLSSLLL